MSEPEGEDFAGDCTSRGYVRVGESVTGGISRDGDEDAFRVELESGAAYDLVVKGACVNIYGQPMFPERHGGSLSWVRITIRTAEGATPSAAMGDGIPDWSQHDGDACAWTTVRADVFESGSYYIHIDSPSTRAPQGTYTVEVHAVADDCGAAAAAACALTALSYSEVVVVSRGVEWGTSGELETYKDHDWYSVELQSGLTYLIEAHGQCSLHTDFGGWLPDPAAKLVTSAGTAPTASMATHINPAAGAAPFTDDNSGVCDNARMAVSVAQSGTYYVVVNSAMPRYYYWFGDYVVMVVDVTDHCTSDTSTTCEAAVIAAPEDCDTPCLPDDESGQYVAAFAAQSDWWSVDLLQDVTYQLAAKRVPSNERFRLRDPELVVRDSSGAAVPGASDKGSGTDHSPQWPLNTPDSISGFAVLAFTPSVSGEYFIEVTGEGTHVGAYRLWVVRQ